MNRLNEVFCTGDHSPNPDHNPKHDTNHKPWTTTQPYSHLDRLQENPPPHATTATSCEPEPSVPVLAELQDPEEPGVPGDITGYELSASDREWNRRGELQGQEPCLLMPGEISPTVTSPEAAVSCMPLRQKRVDSITPATTCLQERPGANGESKACNLQ